MLTHPKAVQLIKKARQANVANPWRSIRDFEHIIQDFFSARIEGGRLQGTKICDFGPGQYDMLRLFRDAGAECTGVDNDPAVLAVGECLGIEVLEMDMKKEGAFKLDRSFDGLFCKFSINAFWSQTPELLESQMNDLCSLLFEEGWGWVAPWNGVPKKIVKDKEHIAKMLDTQREIFISNGWTAKDLTKAEIAHYGVNGSVANNVLFLRNM